MSPTATHRPTRAVLAFESSAECPFSSVDGDIIDAQNSLVDQSCHCQYVVDSSGGEETVVGHTSRKHESDCACHVFGEYECVPDVLAVEDDLLVVSVFLPDRDIIADLVADLRSICDQVSLRRIADDPDDVEAARCEVDLTQLTAKQRRALNLATERGYYEQPSGVSLAELAADLGVSKQAVSQRLRAAENELFEQLVD